MMMIANLDDTKKIVSWLSSLSTINSRAVIYWDRKLRHYLDGIGMFAILDSNVLRT